MSRNKDFLLADSKEELNRRKLRAIRQCLKVLEEDFVEPNQRNSDLCPMSKVLHDDVKDEDTDVFGFSSTESKTDFKLGLRSGDSRRLGSPFSHSTEEKKVQHPVSSNVGLRDKAALAPSGDMDSKTVEEIDGALYVAICNLGHLHDADEILKYLELKVKQEGDKVAEAADRTFDELITSLCSRKRKLCAELAKSISNYSASIAKAKEVIEEKKKCLIGAIRIAKELKMTPSVRIYCDVTQVICNLKLSIDTEVSRVNSLKEKISPRFSLNTDEITSLLKNLGKIEWGTTGHEDNGQHTLTLDDKEVLSCDTQSSVENMFLAHCRESKIKALVNKPDVHKEVKNTQVQETLPMICHQSIPALPKSPSSPDVIIEEIFEDDLEKFPAEYHADEQRKELFNKETPFQHKAGSAELVFVSHVINPCHFYIRRYSQKKEAWVLEKKLKKFCCSKSSYLLSSDVLELGARAFIKSKETGIWCRGTITKLIPLKSKNKRKPFSPIRYKVCDIALLEIFLIDFGSSAVLTSSGYVPAERPEPAALQTIETDDFSSFIRKPDQHIEAELAAVPPLAVRCSLKDVVPKNASEGWGEEAKTKFLGMVNNKVVLMTIFREEDGVLIVDLKKPPFNKTNNNMPVSLKDALVFLDLARFRSQLPSESENNTILQYSPPKIPQERGVISAVVCHINSPSDFYLQLRESLDPLDLPKKIQEVYKHEDEKNLKIVCPVEGQACIVKQSDGNWYRAQIIGLPSREEVTVKYVDCGKIANLSLKDIRRVKKEVLSFPEKAFRCRLAFIEPYKGESEWNRKAKERFEEMTKDKLMLCLVVEILDNNILSVELFDSSAVHARSFSINLQLIKEDLASSYVPGSTENTAVRPNEIWDVPLEGIPETSEALNPSDMESVDEGDFKSLRKKELQVRVSHVVSPSKIFIQWLSSERVLKSLQEKMASIYKDSQPQSMKWESNMHCAVYIHDLKQWQRGQIIRIVSETSVEVLLYDSGSEKTVDISCLRKLEENVKMIRTLAVECSLADIRPTGGSTQWTETVCECLSYYLAGAQVKIIIQESDAASTLPVKILCRDETGQLIDISEHLVKKGLAFRNRRTDEAAVACSDSKEHLKVCLEQENTQLDSCNSKTARARNRVAPEETVIVSGSEQKSCETNKALLHSGVDEIYKSPIIPEAKAFQAVVTYVGLDGTIYIVPKSFETELNKLMTEIQSKFKCLGLLEPYGWKKGEACVVRGSDTMWYRGKVVELYGSTLQVQYIDYGCMEKIPQCHLYPTTLYTGIPPFCIPCQLYKTVPMGNFWQQDAVNCLQELLTNQEVEIHVQELPDNPWGKLSINLYFGGMSLSSFMAHQKYCVAEDGEDISELIHSRNKWFRIILKKVNIGGVQSLQKRSKASRAQPHPRSRTSGLAEVGNCSSESTETESALGLAVGTEQPSSQELIEGAIPDSPSYVLPPLPDPGDILPVRITHFVSPKEVYICFEPSERPLPRSAPEGDAGCDSELQSLEEALKWCNKCVESLPLVTNFQTEMPCLVEYWDGSWYRAKLLPVKEFDPVKILVQFVDYGNYSVVPASRLRHIPYHLLKYPVQAVRALLAGFKPALYDKDKKRIPYSPEWTVEALWAMIECVEGKQLSASILAVSPEVTISLYGDDQNLVHMKLIEMGFADLDE